MRSAFGYLALYQWPVASEVYELNEGRHHRLWLPFVLHTHIHTIILVFHHQLQGFLLGRCNQLFLSLSIITFPLDLKSIIHIVI